ncbi:hypothetical protein B0H66DRAFT_552328 [Apodospora peruviana]|uniref:Uncharacterized protein n=1 Tax=Apodospora peruviana TaxID=516989 RepID=A0AAE0IAL4_9PEZI|nr:hypothetical protein B0H66DRAFT_552328 [Apodospora peruviana]
MQWSKSMFFGDRLQAKNGENMFFIEIQLKRISGADDNLLTRCGVNPRYVWLSLRDMDHAIDPTIMSGTLRLPQFDFNFKKLLPSVTDSPEGSGKIASDVVDKKGSDNTQDEQQQNLITPPTPRLASVDLPTRNLTRVAEASLKRLAAFGRSGTTNIEKKAKVEEESGAPAQPGIDLSAPDLVTVPLSDDDAKDEATAANDGKPSGIPRSLPMPHSNSWGNIVAVAGDGDDKNNNGDSVVIDKEQFSDDGIGLGIGNSDPKTEDATPLVQNCLAPHLPALQKTLRVKREEMADDLAKDPAFPERKEKSSIYVVRAVAMPYPPYAPNVFSGPRIGDRYATLLSSGGWVVPPLEERIKWRNVHYKTNLPTSTTDSSTADDKTRVQVCCAKSANFDWSNNGPPRYYGEGAPVWRELADPCLEDVHWMVWQLLAGKQFVGFRTGSGFGMVRGNTSGDRVKLDECPFSSPSREAIRLSKEMEMELLASASLANDVKAEPETETEIQFL